MNHNIVKKEVCPITATQSDKRIHFNLQNNIIFLLSLMIFLLSTLQFNLSHLKFFPFWIYRAHRLTQDVLLCLTTTVASYIDKKAYSYAKVSRLLLSVEEHEAKTVIFTSPCTYFKQYFVLNNLTEFLLFSIFRLCLHHKVRIYTIFRNTFSCL